MSIPPYKNAHPSTLRNLVVTSEIHVVQVTSPKLGNLMARRNMLMIPSGVEKFREVQCESARCGSCELSRPLSVFSNPRTLGGCVEALVTSRTEPRSTARLRGRFGVVFDDAQLSKLGCRSVEGL